MATRTARRRPGRARITRRHASDSRLMAWLARAGLAARGVMYVLVGVIAVQIAVEDSRQQADRTGAVRLVAHTPFGSVILWLLVVGFAGMTLWRLSEAAWGAAARAGATPATGSPTWSARCFTGRSPSACSSTRLASGSRRQATSSPGT